MIVNRSIATHSYFKKKMTISWNTAIPIYLYIVYRCFAFKFQGLVIKTETHWKSDTFGIIRLNPKFQLGGWMCAKQNKHVKKSGKKEKEK